MHSRELSQRELDAAIIAWPQLIVRNGDGPTAEHPGSAGLGAGDGESEPLRSVIDGQASWLELNERYLILAKRADHPLLARVKWLSTYCARLEGFLKVAFLKSQKRIAAGTYSQAYVETLHATLAACLQRAATVWSLQLEPALRAERIAIVGYADLTDRQQARLARYFQASIFPVCTPLAVDAAHPFPSLASGSTTIAVDVEYPGLHQPSVAFLSLPRALPRLIAVPVDTGESSAPGRGDQTFIWLEDLTIAHLDAFFRGVLVGEAHVFRVLRQERLDPQDWLEAVPPEHLPVLEHLKARLPLQRSASVTALQVRPSMPEALRALLLRHLGVSHARLYVLDAPAGIADLKLLTDLPRPELHYPPFKGRKKLCSAEENLFKVLRSRDLLLHHPYDSSKQVVEFVKRAADDARVVAIKQTLYKADAGSPMVAALLRAAAHGKSVTALVEVRSHGNEESDLAVVQTLHAAQVNVVYGLPAVRTHCKVTLVTRRERQQLGLYAHIGTGNYAVSKRTDISILTAEPTVTADVALLFDHLTGQADAAVYRQLLVGPWHLRQALVARIDRESMQARCTGGGRLIFKVHSLADPAIIDALYRASAAGVTVELIIRSRCCLRPRMPGLSERIRVVVPTGQFPEHSRLFYFQNNGAEELFLGSTDLMTHNLDGRVEVLAPVLAAKLRRYLVDTVLEGYLRDTATAMELGPDNRLQPVAAAAHEPPFNLLAAWPAGGRRG